MSELRPVCGYEGRYSVTADGRVWAHPNSSRSKGRWLRTYANRRGYHYAPLWNGVRLRNFLLHRVVAIAWIPNPDALPQVNHRDGDKANNAATNLEWCSASHNARHALQTGLRSMDAVQRGLRAYRAQQEVTNGQ